MNDMMCGTNIILFTFDSSQETCNIIMHYLHCILAFLSIYLPGKQNYSFQALNITFSGHTKSFVTIAQELFLFIVLIP